MLVDTVNAFYHAATLQKYLSPDDFLAAFGMTKDAFYAQPQWKQEKQKKTVKLW